VADGRERTAEEREAARRERERRRAGVADQPDPSVPDHIEPDLTAPGHPEPDGLIAPEHPDPDGLIAPEHPDPDDPEPAHEDHSDESAPDEVPSGTRRVSRLHHSGHGRKPRARTVRPRRGRATQSRRHSWVGRAFSLVPLVLAAVVIWFAIELFEPFGGSPHGSVTVVVPAHSSASQIGTLLEHDGVISSGFFFNLRATLDGERGHLRAGTYHFQLGMSYASVLTALTKAPKAAQTTQLTISEGHTRQYIAGLLRRQRIKGNYVAATRSSKLLNPHTYGAPRHVASLEGFLFPDTFSLVDPVRVSALVADQLRDFKQRFATVNLGYAHRKHLSDYDVVKIASLIEAEAASDRARPLVASVIYNRLADGMMLQFDSTTRYATGNFTRPLTVSQLHSTSPYNTHTHLGLPPTPIDSPGVASIQAAAHPARSHYLYFFAKPCSNATVFATSYAQFQHLLAVDRRNHC
jgi:UPF0755 protein